MRLRDHLPLPGLRVLEVVCLLVVTLIAGCSDDGGDTARTSDRRPSTAADGSLEWEDCDVAQDAECATLRVPLDWNDPDGPQIDLALGRIPASGDRIGSLLTNPGGPGGSGLEFIGYQPFSPDVESRFDIVSWDPRGVGRSTAVTCGKNVDPFLALDPDPDDAGEQQDLDEAAERVSSECAAADADLLPHVGTPDTARDMEAIRVALDEEAVSFVGFSYGTAIGQQYAALFPDRVRAMVLDGVVDPAQTFIEWQLGQISGFDAAFASQATGCRSAGRTACGVADLAAAYDEVHARVEVTPLDPGSNKVGPAELATAAIYTAYGSDGWQDLGPALADALEGDGARLRELADAYYDLGGYTAYAAIECLDAPTPEGEAAFTAFVDRARAQSPRFGGPVANELRPCATWPVRPADGRQSLGPLTAPGTPTIVVIGNTGDPATPLANAEAVAARLGSAHLVRVNVDGHTAYGSDECVTATVDEYLIDPTKPVTTTDCN